MDILENKTLVGQTRFQKPGPESIISDGLFSIIIFIYVSVTFFYVFYAFCFKLKEEDVPSDEEELDKNLDISKDISQ